MKRIITASSVLLTAIVMLLGQSCGQQHKYSDETLKSFLLSGVYAIDGYGGDKTMRGYIKGSSDSEIINGYKDLLIFCFKPEQADGCKGMLSEWWDVNNREELLETLEQLKTSDFEYKAWDYARLGNNAANGYCAGYMSEEEVVALLEETLILAQAKYSSWEEYHNDFILGRKNWNPTSTDMSAFKKLTKEMQEGDDSIFKLIPLN